MFVAIPKKAERVRHLGAIRLVGDASPTTAEAVRSFFSRTLRAYASNVQDEANLEDSALPQGYLIHYAPCRISSKGYNPGSGRTRGPYRLGVAPDSVRVNLQRAQAFWSGRDDLPGSTSSIAPDTVLGLSPGELYGGSLSSMRAAVRASLQQVLHGEHQSAAPRYVVASLWELLANLDMELGQPVFAIRAARMAFRHFDILGHAPGLAHCLEIEAHAFGQLGTPNSDMRSVRLIERAIRLYVDRSRSTRKQAGRAAYVGTLGHRFSKVGRYRRAERHLKSAARLCEEAGTESWFRVWRLRAAENGLGSGDLASASNTLEQLGEIGEFATVPQRAAYARVRARFHALAGDWQEADLWTNRAMDFGLRFKMANQLRLLQPLVEELTQRRGTYLPGKGTG